MADYFMSFWGSFRRYEFDAANLLTIAEFAARYLQPPFSSGNGNSGPSSVVVVVKSLYLAIL